MPKLSEKELLALDAKRDLNAELIAAAADLSKGRVGRVMVPDGKGGYIESPVMKARFASRLSQAKFAALLGVSLRTLQQWEQGRRTPTGAARTLIRIAEKHPRVLKAVA